MGKLDKKILEGEEWEDSRIFISRRQIKVRKVWQHSYITKTPKEGMGGRLANLISWKEHSRRSAIDLASKHNKMKSNRRNLLTPTMEQLYPC